MITSQQTLQITYKCDRCGDRSVYQDQAGINADKAKAVAMLRQVAYRDGYRSVAVPDGGSVLLCADCLTLLRQVVAPLATADDTDKEEGDPQ